MDFKEEYMYIREVIEDIIKDLQEVKQEYTKLEYNLYNTQLQFDFGEEDGEIKLNVLRQED